MKSKVNLLTIVLILITILFIGSSIFIVIKIKEKAPSPPIKTEAAKKTYRKVVVLAQPSPTIESFVTPTPLALLPITEEPTPTSTLLAQEPTPTEIQLVTTPIVTPEPTATETPIETPIETASPADGEGAQQTEQSEQQTPTPTERAIETLPESGIFSATILIMVAAVALIFFSFIL